MSRSPGESRGPVRVEHLIILTFPKKVDPETQEGALALFQKYQQAKFPPRSISLIEVAAKDVQSKTAQKNVLDGKFEKSDSEDDLVYKVVKGQELVGGRVSSEVAGSSNVGIYIICHGYGRKPTVFEAQASSMKTNQENWSKNSATALAKMLKRLGITRLRKLSLLMCGCVDAGGDPLFVTILAREIRKEVSGSDFVVAGYDDYVSVVSTGETAGRKLVGPSKGLAKGSSENEQHKCIYWVSQGATTRVPPNWSGEGQWSDKA